jgi:hypothetical protein
VTCSFCGAHISIEPSAERPCSRCGAWPAVEKSDANIKLAVQRRTAGAIENCAIALVAIQKALEQNR